MNEPTRSKTEFARRGDELFERVVRPRLDPEVGARAFVAIDVETGDYEIGRDELAASDRLVARRPGAQIWLRRIGTRYAYRLGAGRAGASA